MNSGSVLRAIVVAVVFAAGACTSGSDEIGEDWPGRRPIYVAVFVAPGGATDLANRAMAAAMERELGTNFTVLNMPGAHGGVGAAYVWNAARNGRAWLGMSEAALGLSVLGAHSTTSEDWRHFLIGGTPGVISVPQNAPYETIEDLLDAVRSAPGRVRIASSVPGTAWHVQYLALSEAAELDFRWIAYQGSHPSQIAALNGEVDVVLTGLGEQIEFLRSGRLRPLAIVGTESASLDGIGTIPALTSAVPAMESYLPLQQFVGFALPADTPALALERIEDAFERAMTSEEVRSYSSAAHASLIGLSGEAARDLVTRQEQIFTWLLYESGLTEHPPDRFGIARPASSR